jgi:hypothetical protein
MGTSPLPPSPIPTNHKLTSIFPPKGLRRSRRQPLRLHSISLPHPLHLTHPLPLHLGHDPLHPLDIAVWTVWKHVYPCERAGGWGDYTDEACGVGGFGECAALVDIDGRDGGLLG